MSMAKDRIIKQQQETMRRQLVAIEKYRTAVNHAIPMLLAGHNEQALKDLKRVAGGAK